MDSSRGKFFEARSDRCERSVRSPRACERSVRSPRACERSVRSPRWGSNRGQSDGVSGRGSCLGRRVISPGVKASGFGQPKTALTAASSTCGPRCYLDLAFFCFSDLATRCDY